MGKGQAMTRILVTGAAGFVGSHLTHFLGEATDWQIVAMVRSGTAGTLHRLYEHPAWEKISGRVRVVWHDLRSPISDFVSQKVGPLDYILAVGANSHVDRSCQDPVGCVEDNVNGQCNLLEFARKQKNLKRFVYWSTDEVYGSAPVGQSFLEDDRCKAGNVYAATKAAAEQLTLAYGNTWNVPFCITRCTNIIGPMQSSEKFLPLVIKKILAGETVTIHSNADKTVSGSRVYIDVDDVCRGTKLVIDQGANGETYNITGAEEISNLQLAQMVAEILKKPLKYELHGRPANRPHPDMRYSTNGAKLRGLGFKLEHSVADCVARTVQFYLSHPEWLA
jgi:dTDP-glucose 4,6-dehydratase